MNSRISSIARTSAWLLAYLAIAATTALVTGLSTGMPAVDAFQWAFGTDFSIFTDVDMFWGNVPPFLITYCILHVPVALAEVTFLTCLYRKRSRRTRWWLVGVILPVGLELIVGALNGTPWVIEGALWLVHWIRPLEYVDPFEYVWRNAVSNLIPPLVAGGFVTWLARRQSERARLYGEESES